MQDFALSFHRKMRRAISAVPLEHPDIHLTLTMRLGDGYVAHVTYYSEEELE